MKKSIIYYSKTGNTKSVVERFDGFERIAIIPEDMNPNITNPVLIQKPSVDDAEYLIFASPVHGFQLARVMQVYLKQLNSLENIVIDIFVTHQFPFACLGGNQALKQMEKLIESKNGVVRYKTSINWPSKKRENIIEQMLNLYIV
ncbi:MAG: hypothetical protein WC152_04660 [Candidatus Izemoplasmatales bacterium]